MQNSLLTYIGRFQLLHNGQVEVIKQALEQADHLLILVGSSNRSPDIRNPFSFEERAGVLQQLVEEEWLQGRVTIKALPDTVYGNGWYQQVINRIEGVVEEYGFKGGIGLIGHDKDATSYYLKHFPQFGFVQQPHYGKLNSSDFRRQLFLDGVVDPEDVPSATLSFLDQWCLTYEFFRLRDEYFFVENYQSTWPDRIYPAADAVVTGGGKILVIRRGRNPGKGMIALPGGFIEPGERFFDAALRELQEETSIDTSKLVYTGEYGLFDDPQRDVRRRITSNAFHFHVADESLPLPKVEARDDADDAFWMPIDEFLEDPRRIFSDHWFVANAFKIRNDNEQTLKEAA